MKREVVQITRDSDEVIAGTFAEVVARGPDHLLVRPIGWDQHREVIVPADAVTQPRRIVENPLKVNWTAGYRPGYGSSFASPPVRVRCSQWPHERHGGRCLVELTCW